MFDPRLSVQRFQWLIDRLQMIVYEDDEGGGGVINGDGHGVKDGDGGVAKECGGVKSVVDFGAGELSAARYLRSLESLTEMAAVEIDKCTIEEKL